MAQQDPCWTEAMEAGEWFADQQRAHRADGRVTPEEAQQEADGFRLVVFPQIVNTADCCEYGQAAMRRGPEAPRATRLRNDRAKRLGNVVPFPAVDPLEAA